MKTLLAAKIPFCGFDGNVSPNVLPGVGHPRINGSKERMRAIVLARMGQFPEHGYHTSQITLTFRCCFAFRAIATASFERQPLGCQFLHCRQSTH
jgi:hypothetical protein